MKKIIGLTGSFGSGKSTVANYLESFGAKVIDADALAHEALMPESEVFHLIVPMFGSEVLRPGGQIDRKILSQIVFRDGVKRKALESLIHPYVFARIEGEIRKAEKDQIVLDVPLLFETGLDQRCDQIIVVRATEDVIISRLHKKGFTAEEIHARLRVQKPLQEKILSADFVIDNQGSLEETRRQVREVWDRLVSSEGPSSQSPKGR